VRRMKERLASVDAAVVAELWEAYPTLVSRS
jgi:hypothetical protein